MSATTTISMLVKSTNQNTRVKVLIVSADQTKHVPGSYIWSQRLPALTQKYFNCSRVEEGKIFKLNARIHSTQTWIESVSTPSTIEVEVAEKFEKSGFNSGEFILVGLSASETNLLCLFSKLSEKDKLATAKKFHDSLLHKNIVQYLEFLKNLDSAPKSVVPLFDDNDIEKQEKEPMKVNENYFYVDSIQASAFRSAGLMLKNDIAPVVKILMVGESGWGKTSLPKHFAAVNDLDFMRMDCAKIRDPEEWFGFREAREGSTSFIKSDFVEAIEEGNVVIVLDEINRLEPSVSNTLFPILDDSREISIYNQKIKVGPKVIFAATINIGFEYVGTFSIDEALLNRFDVFCPVGKIPTSEEAKVLSNRVGIAYNSATEIVTCAESIRSTKIVHCSLRTTLSIARLSKALGGESPSKESMRLAFQHIVIDRAESKLDTEKRPLIDLVNGHFGPIRKSKSNLKVF